MDADVERTVLKLQFMISISHYQFIDGWEYGLGHCSILDPVFQWMNQLIEDRLKETSQFKLLHQKIEETITVLEIFSEKAIILA